MLKTTEIIQTKSFKLAIYAKGSVNSEKMAVILLGKLDTKDYSHSQKLVEFLADRGYFALSFDPPGTWESGDNIELYTTSNYIKAVNEVIDYYENKPTVLIGHSKGGAMTMVVGCKNPSITHIISMMSSGKVRIHSKEGEETGNHTMTDKFRVHNRDTPLGYENKFQVFKVPKTMFEDKDQFDLFNILSECKKPKLFIAGLKDTSVKKEDVQKLYDVSANPKFIQIIDSIHGYRRNDSSIVEVNNIIWKFLSNQL